MSLPIEPSDPQSASASLASELITRGYCLVPGLLPPEEVASLDEEAVRVFAASPFCQGDFYGHRTKRFGRLLLRLPAARLLAEHPLVLAIVRQVLDAWCECIQLNVMQAIEIHPGEIAQLPHRDQDMWAGEKGRIEYLVNVMWPLTPFRADNGATVVWPGSHGQAALEGPPGEAGMPVACAPGSALLFLGSTLHHGGANRSAQPRRGIVVGYSLGWLKPYENPWLAYPPHIARDFPPSLAALVGYRQHRPNLGNYEGQCPSVLLEDQVPSHPAAIDALTCEQAALAAAHAEAQRARRAAPRR